MLTKSNLKLISSINLAHLNRSAPTDGLFIHDAESVKTHNTKGRRRPASPVGGETPALHDKKGFICVGFNLLLRFFDAPFSCVCWRGASDI